VGGSGPSLGIVLEYPGSDEKSEQELRQRTIQLSGSSERRAASRDKPVVGFIGSGNYATQVLIPAFAETPVTLKSVASSTGVSSVHAGRKYGFQQTTTDSSTIVDDSEIDTVVITTRHDSHARFVCEALKAGKHVFVEKPLALTREEAADGGFQPPFFSPGKEDSFIVEWSE